LASLLTDEQLDQAIAAIRAVLDARAGEAAKVIEERAEPAALVFGHPLASFSAAHLELFAGPDPVTNCLLAHALWLLHTVLKMTIMRILSVRSKEIPQ